MNCMDKWMNGLMREWVDGWRDERTNLVKIVVVFVVGAVVTHEPCYQ